jgi:hypothetical protein
MKPLSFPTIRDKVVLRRLSQNRRLHIYPRLHNHLIEILNQYLIYWTADGNASSANAPTPSAFDNNFKNALKGLFLSPPKEIQDHLSNIRNNISPEVCPMCGSLKTGSIDHILPKGTFAEFSIFSKNLVPACDCNIRRNESYRGDDDGGRVLHPYFDDGLDQRLIRAIITDVDGNYETPLISLEVCLNQDHPLFNAATFHLNAVVLKTTVISYLESMWPRLRRFPDDFFNLPTGQFSDADFHSAVVAVRDMLDRRRSTPNNWESMLLSGLAANTPAEVYLANMIRQDRGL